ncbi:MAG: hypothetical protein M1833_002223 [Piccolia ochrophora]|nr:MAG: hypothetical protein M1833_002223 [Piccolia ochrophora]
MTTKKNKPAATDEELSKLFEGIGDDHSAPAKAPKAISRPAGRTVNQANDAASKSEQDLLAELDNLASERPGSRPHTPRLPSGAVPGSTKSPKRTSTSTPPPGASNRTSEDKLQIHSTTRRSGDSATSGRANLTPATSQSNGDEADAEKSQPETAASAENAGSGGGWWGGIFATASAAVKTAEAAVKEIQQNEEAKRWADQVKGNVGALRGFGGEIRSRALPTFTNILHTLAPPISSHERLQIHTTHDFTGYPSLDPLIYQTFSRVMAQVEGGDLMVIQRGQESSPRRASDVGFTGSSASGWSDGPWWRQPADRRNLGAVKGLVEGTKLVKVGAESYAHEFYETRGGVEEAAKRAAEVLSESNPVRSSDIFLAIQAINETEETQLFGGPATQTKDEAVVDPDAKPEELIQFAVYLYDPVHSITFHTVTQAFPQKWIDWLDARSTALKSPNAQASPSQEKSGGFFSRRSQDGGSRTDSDLPEEIAEIISTGGVDPREWVSEWVEETLVLGVGVVAQKYVARRMGVGEGGIGRGKAREEALESGGGEAARAV